MLIVGQPKSASTSLLKTVAAIGRLRFQNGISRNANYNKDCQGFSTIQKYHGTMSRRDEPFFNYWLNKRDVLYKEHILPTKEHVEILSRLVVPFVVLLRNPEHSFDNYVRLVASWKAGAISQKANSILHVENVAKLNMEGLRQDLIDFYQGWKSQNIWHALVIEYDDLILHYDETIRMVMDHLGIKGKVIPLVRAMGNRDLYSTYTGVGERRLKEGKT